MISAASSKSREIIGHARYMAEKKGITPSGVEYLAGAPWEVVMKHKIPEQEVARQISCLNAYGCDQFLNAKYLNATLLLSNATDEKQVLSFRDSVHDPYDVIRQIQHSQAMIAGLVLHPNYEDQRFYDAWTCVRGIAKR